MSHVEIADQREIHAEGVRFRDLDAGNGGIHHDLPGCGIDLGEQFRDPLELFGIVVDHENRGLRPVIPPHVGEVLFDAAFHLADEAELASIGEQRGGEFARILRGEVFQLEHSTLGLSIESLHASEFLLRVDVDELAFLDPSETVGLENGVHRFVERHVEQVRTDHR